MSCARLFCRNSAVCTAKFSQLSVGGASGKKSIQKTKFDFVETHINVWSKIVSTLQILRKYMEIGVQIRLQDDKLTGNSLERRKKKRR